MKRYTSLLEKLRREKPLVHHITNYVTVNDCANITLAIGASPIMADALDEVSDITAISQALVINMGTLNERTVPSMIKAAKTANEKGIPVIFDPVGAGASSMRNETAARLLGEAKIDVLRGNISEIRFLAGLQSETKGVDASDKDLSSAVDSHTVAKSLARRLKCVVAITGQEDVVSDGKSLICIKNGHPKLSEITGTGCMCSSLVGSFCACAPNTLLDATVAAILSMGIAGEMAFDKVGHLGNGSFHMVLLDVISFLRAETLEGRAKLYEA